MERLILNALFAFLMLPLLSFGSDWKPDFLIVGAQKAGTTVLHQLINQHPQVVKKRNEVHFFDANFDRGVEWYQNQFKKRPSSSHLIGDKSPYYIFHPFVPERVYSLYPKVKIIVLLRNPVDRAYSQYWMNIRIGKEDENVSFEEAIAAEPARIAGEYEKLRDPSYTGSAYRRYSYLARGVYVDQIKNWLNYFPKEQMLILSSTDLRNSPKEVLKRCFSFLSLPQHPIILSDPEKHSDYEPMNSKTRKQLAAYFLPYNKALEELLDREFHWD
jgi:Sulfotransferase domain